MGSEVEMPWIPYGNHTAGNFKSGNFSLASKGVIKGAPSTFSGLIYLPCSFFTCMGSTTALNSSVVRLNGELGKEVHFKPAGCPLKSPFSICHSPPDPM